MKAALVGYGYWGKIVHRYIEECPEFSLEMICSPKLKKEGIFKNDINEILERKDIEAVFICTPVETHYDLCKIFLTNGRHVFCEKPTAKTVEEYLELESIALEKNKCLFTDYTYTVSPAINLMKDLLKEIGTVRDVECRIMQFGKFYPDADVFEVIGIHMLSALIYLFPQKNIVKVNYEQNVSFDLCFDGTVNFIYNDSMTAHIRCSLIYPEKERKISVFGTKGVLVYDMCSDISLRIMRFSDSKGEVFKESYQEWSMDENNNLFYAIREFCELIKKDEHGNLILSRRVLNLLCCRDVSSL